MTTVDGRWTLALDTATPATVAAAVAPASVAGAPSRIATASRIEIPAPTDRPAHTRRLLALAEQVLEETGGSWATVGRIVVGLGPGTFTGIRVGVATARALGLASGADVVGVPSSAALALAAREADGSASGRVLVVQDARRREFFLTLADFDELPGGAAALQPWTAPQDGLGDAVRALDRIPTVAVGDGAMTGRAELEALGIHVPPDPALHRIDGLALVAAAAAVEAGGPGQPPPDVRPVYARAPDAVPTADRR